MNDDADPATVVATLDLTPAMRNALLSLPDCGGHELWRLHKDANVSLHTLRALGKRGLAEIAHHDPGGDRAWDRWTRTRAGHPSRWMTEESAAPIPR